MTGREGREWRNRELKAGPAGGGQGNEKRRNRRRERERERERRDVEMANFERVKREIWDKRNYVRKRGELGGGGEGQVKNREST